MPNHSYQHKQKSWLKPSLGEWHYFLDEHMANEANLSGVDIDYIWLVTPAKVTNEAKRYRITHQAIESVIEQLAGVNQAIVFGVPHEQKGNAIHLYVELTNRHIALVTLSNAINAKLAGYFGEFVCPDKIKFIEHSPVIRNKKLARKTYKFQDLTINYAA